MCPRAAVSLFIFTALSSLHPLLIPLPTLLLQLPSFLFFLSLWGDSADLPIAVFIPH